MPKHSPTPIDKYIGNQLRLLRVWRNISRGEIAKYLGISHQQIEKYEKGTNRISAATLLTIAQFLDVPLKFFFEDSDVAEVADDHVFELRRFLSTAEGRELVSSFLAIPNKKARMRIVELIKILRKEP